ncbi:MAG TPA: hypothetical protein VEQ42_07585 [Pyrinomonadaceae bacterium]|nr:hypothetical protein [Pyrinomonadaceae bacterium]
MPRRLHSTLIGPIFILVFCALAPDAAGQCVQCKPDGACFTCAPGTTGGCKCGTVQCQDCVVTQPCRKASDCDGGFEPPEEANLVVGEPTIVEIAQLHPRFAVALLRLNRAGGVRNWAKYSSFPARLETADVTHWLKPRPETEAFFKEYSTARRVAGAPIVVYEATVTKVDASRATLHLKVVQGFSQDPAATDLFVDFTDGKATGWRMK